MISFLHDSPYEGPAMGEAYGEALARLDGLRAAIATAEPVAALPKALTQGIPHVSTAELATFEAQAMAMVHAGLDAARAAGKAALSATADELQALAASLRADGDRLEGLITL